MKVPAVVLALGFLVPASAMADSAVANLSNADIAGAKAFAFAALPGECDGDQSEITDDDRSYTIDWSADGEEHHAILFQINCSSHIRSTDNAYVVRDEDGVFSLVAFSVPTYDVEYEDGDDTFTKLKSPPRITGFVSHFLLEDGTFEPDTLTLSDAAGFSARRDSVDVGEWQFEGGEFVLSSYTVDPILEFNIRDPLDDDADGSEGDLPEDLFKTFQIFPESAVK